MLWLNGIGLESLDPKVKLLNVVEQSPKISVKTTENAKYDGLRRLSRNRTTLSIRVDLTIRDRNYYRRREIFDDVLAWLGDGGLLEAGYRDGQSIRVEVADYPNLSSIKDFANSCSVLFTAYDPGWRAITPTKATLTTITGTAQKVTIQPPGTEATTFLEFDIKNTGSSVMDTATVSVNGRSLAFTSLGLSAGATLNVAYDADGFLSMRIGTTNVFSKRTAASADDLVVYQRKINEVTVVTATAASVTLKATGRYR